jgi:hypothetical protein
MRVCLSPDIVSRLLTQPPFVVLDATKLLCQRNAKSWPRQLHTELAPLNQVTASHPRLTIKAEFSVLAPMDEAVPAATDSFVAMLWSS